MPESGWYYGNHYPQTVTVNGKDYVLPKGFRSREFLTPLLKGRLWIQDYRGNDCDVRIINGQPCLISIRGVWDLKEE